MNIFKKIINKFKTVYCEDCEHCTPPDRAVGPLIGEDGPMCRAYPLEIDCSDVDTFVNKNRSVTVVKTFKRCHRLRLSKSSTLSYCSYCFKFSPKVKNS